MPSTDVELVVRPRYFKQFSAAHQRAPKGQGRCDTRDAEGPHHTKDAKAIIFRVLHKAEAMGQARRDQQRRKRVQ